MSGFFSAVHALALRIPPGKVASYGQLARAAGHPRAARQVGWCMAACPPEIPWHRVLCADGSLPSGTDNALQRALLEAEDVPFLPDGRVDMALARWTMEDLGETL